MLSTDQLRRFITAVYSLVVLVSLLFTLLLIVAFLQPSTNVSSAPVAQTTEGAFTPTPVAPAALTEGQQRGKSLFTGNCAQCHSITDEVLVGPSLKGVRRRTPGDEWLKNWIRNSSALVAAGDLYAVQIFNKFQKIPMSSFTSLSDQDITDILDYLDTAGR